MVKLTQVIKTIQKFTYSSIYRPSTIASFANDEQSIPIEIIEHVTFDMSASVKMCNQLFNCTECRRRSKELGKLINCSLSAPYNIQHCIKNTPNMTIMSVHIDQLEANLIEITKDKSYKWTCKLYCIYNFSMRSLFDSLALPWVWCYSRTWWIHSK